MAQLEIVTKSVGGAADPLVAIDGVPVSLNGEGKGQTTVTGTCGDGSGHMLVISFLGPVGAAMGVTVTCGGAAVCEIKEIKVTPLREPYGASHRSFKL
ncbi:MAG: hypothetical protein J0L50_15025 [Sphingomonadales bacterium]|nr:hypothetical protein [Sphingomonadales bacterium]